MARGIQVAILGDSRLFREALSSRLALEDEIEVVSAAGTIYDVLTRAQGRPIDVLLVYLSIRSALALEIIWDIKLLLPASQIVVLGWEQAGADTARWIEAGAIGWSEHETSYESLLEAIHAVSEGRTFCDPEVVSGVIRRISQLQKANHQLKVLQQEPLSDRQNEVAQLIRLGLVNKEIARHLGVKQPTVKSHVSQVLRKLGVARRGDLDLRRTRRRNGEGG